MTDKMIELEPRVLWVTHYMNPLDGSAGVSQRRYSNAYFLVENGNMFIRQNAQKFDNGDRNIGCHAAGSWLCAYYEQ